MMHCIPVCKHLVRVPAQRAWVAIGIVFLVFYIGEALLFWNGLALAAPLMKLPLSFPLIYPLGFWGVFGWIIFMITRRAGVSRFDKIRGGILSTGVCVGVIGSTFVVMSSVEGTRLGHAILFTSLFTAGISIGGSDVNVGWILAAIFWLAVAVLIVLWPDNHHLITHLKDEDLFVGLGVAGGFIGIGLVPYALSRGQ